MLIRTVLLTGLLLMAPNTVLQPLSDSDVLAVQSPAQGPPVRGGGPVVEQLSIHGGDADMEQAILQAMELYADAGLELPELRIYVHDSYAPCLDNLGLYGKGGDKKRIDVCRWEHQVVVHELAHAWEYHNLGDATREAYLALTGLKVWNDHDVVHPARGIESAADAIKWGLLGGPIQSISVRHYAGDLERYQFLTGTPSPRVADLDTEPTRPALARPAVALADVTVNANAI